MVDVLPPGAVIGGDFVVVRARGEGGMGAVYVVEQQSTGKTRALKVMHREIAQDPSLQKRFEQEARVGARIKSEHVVDIVAAGVDAALGLPFLVMELLDGEDLRRRLAQRGSLPVVEVRALFEQICHALGAAHDAGIVHRDIKPENVFVARAQRAGGDAFTVKVLDFGIAKINAEATTRATHGAVGSPMWMAPEQTQPGPVTPAADVWALGLLAYELFTGRSFWRAANDPHGTTAHLMREIVLDPIPAASARAREQGVDAKLPPGFDAWCARCLHRDPAGRWRDASAAWLAFRGMLDGTPVVTEQFAATAVADSGPPSPFQTAARTPIASTREQPTPLAPAPPMARGSRAPVVIGAAIAVVGIAAAGAAVFAVLTSRGASDVVTITAQRTPASAPPPPPIVSSAPPAVSPVPAVPSASAPAVVVSAPPHASADPKRTIAGGFGDPSDRNGAVLWKVQDRHVRLFTRLVSNESNVADAVVKKAVEWNSWEYLRCYERVYGGAKEMPEGTVTVSFEILDQLPRHAKVESTTFASDGMTDCVRRTLLGQTINAAGPEGKGKATHAFRFVPVD